MEMPRLFKKAVFYLFAKRFVAGETVNDAIRVARGLQERGIYTIINILGEDVKDGKEVARIRSQYLKLIKKLAAKGLHYIHISIKPSQLGLKISEFLYRMSLRMILEAAATDLPEALVEIDREAHEYAKAVREVSLGFASVFFNQRLACQINLNETVEEIQQFIEAGISVRLCKGTAYPGDIKNEEEIRKRFLEQAFLLSEKGNRPAIATHDLYLIDKLRSEENLGFQVVLGIENKEMEKLAQEGKEVGFYIPCGPYWWAYGKRRLKTILKIWWRNFWYRVRRWLKKIIRRET